MSAPQFRTALLLELAEHFLDRYRHGERPPLKEYIDRHPDLAPEIRELFPAIAVLENIAATCFILKRGDTVTKPRRAPRNGGIVCVARPRVL